ncbi:MAG: PqqD family protein [Candidatus Competibacteraceae bacterium]
MITTELQGTQGKEAVLLHLVSMQYFSLNDTGLRIWRLLEEHLSLAAIAGRLVEEYELSIEQAQKSVLDLAQALLAENLVEVAPTSVP